MCADEDSLFSAVHKHELVEDGLAYRIMAAGEGPALLALEPSPVLPASGDLPLHVVDIVRWGKPKQLHLDRSGLSCAAALRSPAARKEQPVSSFAADPCVCSKPLVKF